jgi:hypothetical protein
LASGSTTGPRAKSNEPDVEILLKLRRLSFLKAIVSNECDVKESHRVLENTPGLRL